MNDRANMMDRQDQTSGIATEAPPTMLAHHFDSPVQQYTAAKLGMWVFLATEILMFSGLFCAYAVYRGVHPEIFHAGHYFLDARLGAMNTIILLTSSLTMAWGVRCAQLNRRRALVILLALTFLGGAGFMCVKYVEYKAKWEHGLLLGRFFDPQEDYFAAHFGGDHAEQDDDASETATADQPATPDAASAYVPSAARGRLVFVGTCASCHGNDGAGLANQGANLLTSTFISEHTDAGLLAFVKVGRQPWDADTTMRLQMPPRGGNPTLTDEHLEDVVAYLRQLHDAAASQQGAEQDNAAAGDGMEATEPEEDIQWSAEDLRLLIPRSSIQPPADPPQGINPEYENHQNVSEALPHVEPADLRVFFTIYFLLTGLHGIHVLIGMAMLLVLMLLAMRGRFHSRYYTPVDLGGLYWHLVDLIWIFLFPLLYLIG